MNIPSKTAYPFFKAISARNFFLCFFVLANSLLLSQKKLVFEADNEFNAKKYGEAIVLYQKIYEKEKDRTVLLKMADANYLNENYPQAQKLYAEYFRDTVYESIAQFTNYAKSSEKTGKIELATKLYLKIYEVTQDETAKSSYDIFKFYLDNIATLKVYDLEASYNCITIDASDSFDSLAVPLLYLWDFGDGKSVEGTTVDHCFSKIGENKVILSIKDRKTGMIKTNDTTLIIFIEKPIVTFNSPKIGKRYFYLEFDASETSIPGYDILEYLWEMDNGEIVPGKKIKYQYNESLDYQVKLTIIAKNKYNNTIEIYASKRKLEIKENYEMPSKKFTDSLDGAK